MPENKLEQCEKCINERRILILEEAEKLNREAHNKIYGRLEETNVNYTETRLNIQNIFKTLDEMSRDIKSMKERDGKRWDSVVTSIIVAIASGAVGFFISKL